MSNDNQGSAIGRNDPFTMSMLMTPDLANFSGKVHGGALLKLLDQVAYTCASSFCGHYVVTLSVDQVQFLQPIHVGQLVTFRARINFVGRTSMEVGIRVESENIQTGEKRHTNTCYFTMVAMDDEGQTVAAPKLALDSQEEKGRYVAAKLRKEIRHENARKLKAIHEKWSHNANEIDDEEFEKYLNS